MRSAFATSSALSAPCYSGRRIEPRGSNVAARATKISLSASAVAVSLPSPSSSLDLLPLAPPPSSRFRSQVARRRRRLRPSLPHSQAIPEEDGGGGGAGSGSDSGSSSSSSEESKAPPLSSSSLSSSSSSSKNKKKTPSASSKSASPLGDLMAMLLPVQKRKSGSRGPPPPTLPQRWRAIKGSARAAAELAWAKALTLPGLSHVVAVLHALDIATAPAREAFTEWKLDVIDRYRTFRAEEVKRAWAWETRSKEQGKAWRAIVYNATCFVFALPYLVLAPANPLFAVVVPLAVGLSAFDHPVFNPVIAAWVLVGLAGKWNPGAFANAVGLPVSALPRLAAGG